MLDIRDFIICLAAAVLAIGALAAGAWPVAILICIIGAGLAAAPK